MKPFRRVMSMRGLLPIVTLSTFLMLGVVVGCLASEGQARSARFVVLSSRADPPALQTRCPDGQCTYVDLEDFSCMEGPVSPVEVLIVGGHSLPPQYLNAPPAAIAGVVRCLRPR